MNGIEMFLYKIFSEAIITDTKRKRYHQLRFSALVRKEGNDTIIYGSLVFGDTLTEVLNKMGIAVPEKIPITSFTLALIHLNKIIGDKIKSYDEVVRALRRFSDAYNLIANSDNPILKVYAGITVSRYFKVSAPKDDILLSLLFCFLPDEEVEKFFSMFVMEL